MKGKGGDKMDNSFLGIKEIYDVSLRATYPVTIGGIDYEIGEALIKFDKVQFAPLIENKIRREATGGYGNAELVSWENTNSVDFSVTEGVISKTGFAILSNSELLNNHYEEPERVHICEEFEVEPGQQTVTLKYKPLNEGCFVYCDGHKHYWELQDKTVTVEPDLPDYAINYNKILVDYITEIDASRKDLLVGKRLLNGYLSLDAKFRMVDDEDGHIKTGIIEIPKVELMSDLAMRLGRDSNLYTYKFQFKGLPVGGRGSQYVCRVIMFDKEIDADL